MVGSFAHNFHFIPIALAIVTSRKKSKYMENTYCYSLQKKSCVVVMGCLILKIAIFPVGTFL